MPGLPLCPWRPSETVQAAGGTVSPWRPHHHIISDYNCSYHNMRNTRKCEIPYYSTLLQDRSQCKIPECSLATQTRIPSVHDHKCRAHWGGPWSGLIESRCSWLCELLNELAACSVCSNLQATPIPLANPSAVCRRHRIECKFNETLCDNNKAEWGNRPYCTCLPDDELDVQAIALRSWHKKNEKNVSVPIGAGIHDERESCNVGWS